MATEASALPITSLINTGTSPSTVANASQANPKAGTTTLGATDFLQLLTTQLANQDPLNPVDDTQSIAQLAQFSSLQATTTLSSNFSAFESNFAVSQASGLLGETVSVATTDASGNSSTQTGTVNSIQVVNGAPQFTMLGSTGGAIAGTNGVPIQFTTNQIVGITK
jgi:flagellar basal-body rod modification protein FlgD